jgi:DNA-binding HxlR family transcriptional regulator
MLLKDCPVREMVDVIEGKWKPLIIFCLKGGTQRYGDLRRGVPEARPKVLTEQLRELEKDKIIARRALGTTNSPRVEYSLTPYGQTLVRVLTMMADWGAKHRKVRETRQSEVEVEAVR